MIAAQFLHRTQDGMAEILRIYLGKKIQSVQTPLLTAPLVKGRSRDIVFHGWIKWTVQNFLLVTDLSGHNAVRAITNMPKQLHFGLDLLTSVASG